MNAFYALGRQNAFEKFALFGFGAKAPAPAPVPAPKTFHQAMSQYREQMDRPLSLKEKLFGRKDVPVMPTRAQFATQPAAPAQPSYDEKMRAARSQLDREAASQAASQARVNAEMSKGYTRMDAGGLYQVRVDPQGRETVVATRHHGNMSPTRGV